jgi:hypothetical protein
MSNACAREGWRSGVKKSFSDIIPLLKNAKRSYKEVKNAEKFNGKRN